MTILHSLTHLGTTIVLAAAFLGGGVADAPARGAGNGPATATEGVAFDAPIILAQSGMGRRFQIIREFHQPAAPNVEKADITIIRCQNSEYYIYRYYRPSGRNYRSIIPGRWGNPLGGRDHWTFDAAAGAACNW